MHTPILRFSRTGFLVLVLLWGTACDVKVKTTDSCGDGIVDPGEACDGLDLGGATCESGGYYAGTLSCKSDCTLDFSACSQRCGDGEAQPEHEDCDRQDLQEKTCTDLGFAAGFLACGDDCRFDYSDCQSVCGDGWTDPLEACDDGNRTPGDGCDAACRVEAGWDCVGTPSFCDGLCGDGQVLGLEVCDDGVNDGTYDGCMADCHHWAPRCGDGLLQSGEGEVCDLTETDGLTCASEGFFGGTLGCLETCDQIDTTPCAGSFLQSGFASCSGGDWIGGVSITSDAAGNLVVGANFKGLLDLQGLGMSINLNSGGDIDLIVLKFAPDGSLTWARRFGGAGDDVLASVATDSGGNIWVTGYFKGDLPFGTNVLTNNSGSADDAFLAKLAPDGTPLWSNRFGELLTSERGIALAVDNTDAVWVTGTFNGTISLGGTTFATAQREVFIARFLSSGAHSRSTTLTGTGEKDVRGLALDQANNVYLTGSFTNRLGPTVEGIQSLDGQDAFVTKFSPLLAYQWARRMGGSTAIDLGRDLFVASSGELWVTGIIGPDADLGAGTLPGFGGADIFVAHLDASGDLVWGRVYGSVNDDFGGTGVSPDADGNLWITGSFMGAATFGPTHVLSSNGIMDFYVGLLDPAGDVIFMRGYGGPVYDSTASLARTPDGRVAVTGSFVQTIDIEGTVSVGNATQANLLFAIFR
ncbi:MAG: hypothetical protein CVU59_08110 [Deltaproteobacteria bacterium HGW-Deltaproteobacteria-17]|nr:MAG: hypothetical protein CVU59_08110 [Deltaproteobacteria bacterium HGW-Deltaproteobacteria-17]